MKRAHIINEVQGKYKNSISIGFTDEYIDKQTIYKNQIKIMILLWGLLEDHKLTIEEANSIIDDCDLTQEINLPTIYLEKSRG